MLYIAAAVHYAGVIYYVIFASGKKQPWAEIDEEGDPNMYDDENWQVERRLTASLGGINNSDDEYGSTMRFLNSI